MLASVAQGIEQRFPKPLVGRSNRLGSTSNYKGLGLWLKALFCISENICFAFDQGALKGGLS